MAIFTDPSIWREHLQWESKFSPQIIHSASQSQLFSNFGSFHSKNNYLDSDFDYDSFINTISSQLSNDVFQNVMKIVYTDSIYKSLQIKKNCPMHIEKDKKNSRRTKSLIYEQKNSLIEENEDFLDIEHLDFCNFDDSSGCCDGNCHSFNSFS